MGTEGELYKRAWTKRLETLLDLLPLADNYLLVQLLVVELVGLDLQFFKLWIGCWRHDKQRRIVLGQFYIHEYG